MTPKRRQLMLIVLDGRKEILPYLHIMYNFRACDEILAWLIENRLTGTNFLSWAENNFGTSLLDVGAFVLKRLERDLTSGKRAIIHGKDWVQ